MAKIEIPDELYKKIEGKLKEADFKTVDEYVEFILKEFFEEDEEEYTPEEEEKVKERLRALGYL